MSGLDSTRRVAVAARSSKGGRGAKTSAGGALRQDDDRETRGRGAANPSASTPTPKSEACDDAAASAERELQEAIIQYQRSSGRMFPTWSEVLEIVRGLGYRKPVEEDAVV